MYNILVVDDSALMRKIMCDIISQIQGFIAKDVCADGNSALRMIRENKYDAVTMNVFMPRMTGLEVLKALQAENISIPVVAISSTIREDRETTRQALGLGAVKVVIRPPRIAPSEKGPFSQNLQDALAAAVGMKGGVRRVSSAPVRPARPVTGAAAAPAARPLAARRPLAAASAPVSAGGSAGVVKGNKNYRGKYGLLAIACSTGGPQALHTMIPMLPGRLGVPGVIVQHMPKGFTASLAERINGAARVNVKEAEDGEILKKDWIYIAPGGRHTTVVEKGRGTLCFHVYDAPPVNNLRPCADVMYDSLQSISTEYILCTVMTGMGSDGCRGIRDLGKVKKVYTISQDEASSVVYGMPKAVAVNGVTDEVVPLTQIANSIKKELGV